MCDWPVIKAIRFDPFDAVGVGDVLVKADGWRARIIDKERKIHTISRQYALESVTREVPAVMPYDLVRVQVLCLGKTVRVHVKMPFETAFTISPMNFAAWRVEGKGTCDKPCCFRHRMHVSDDVDYCMEHWPDLQAGRVPEAALL